MDKKTISYLLSVISRMLSYYSSLLHLAFEKEFKFPSVDGVDLVDVDIKTTSKCPFTSSEVQKIMNDYLHQHQHYDDLLAPFYDGEYLIQPLYATSVRSSPQRLRVTIIFVNNKLAADLVPARYKDYITEQEVKL